LDAQDCLLVIDHFKFSELANILQVPASFVVYHEVSVNVFPQLLVLSEQAVNGHLLDISVIDGDDGRYPAKKGSD
jgi:hypothetical protein